MDEEVITNLKQFISGVISRQTLDIKQDIGQLGQRLSSLEVKVGHLEVKVGHLDAKIDRVEERLSKLEVKVEDSFAGIADMFEDVNTRHLITEVRLSNHDQRIVRLEHKTA